MTITLAIIGLLTIVVILGILLTGICLGVVWYLVKNPPTIVLPEIMFPPINVRADVDMGQVFPTPLTIQFQAVPPDRTPIGVTEEPMPVEVFAYVQQESEEHARVSRGKYARRLRNELGSWSAALSQLQHEDGIEE